MTVSDHPAQDMLRAAPVLVAEDEFIIALALGEMLEDHGVVVVGPAGRLERAVTMAETAEISLALLDVNLRGKPIFPVAEILAARGIPFIFMTGYARADLPPRFADTPMLFKPFNYSTLVRVMAELASPRQSVADDPG